MPPIYIATVRAECRDLELKPMVEDDDDAKMGTHRICAWKNGLHLFRSGVGGNIVVLWSLATDEIADTAAGEVRNMTLIA